MQAIESRNMHVLFYFCTYLSASQEGSLLLLRSLTAQAIQKDPDLAIYVHDEHIKSNLISSRRVLMRLLPELLQHLGSVRLVVDGIDEWNQKEHKHILTDVLRFLPTPSSATICKIIISSRDVPTICDIMQKMTRVTARISLSHEKHSIYHEIERFTEKRLAENQLFLSELDPDGTVVRDVGRLLVEKSEGEINNSLSSLRKLTMEKECSCG